MLNDRNENDMQNLELALPISGQFDFLNDNFRPRGNGREFEWRDGVTGRYFVIHVTPSRDIVTISLHDFTDKSIFDLPFANRGTPREIFIRVSAADDQDQFAYQVPKETLSYIRLTYDTQGNRAKPNDFAYGWGDKFECMARGHYRFSTLPPRINFDTTVEAFKDKLLREDFSTPELL